MDRPALTYTDTFVRRHIGPDVTRAQLMHGGAYNPRNMWNTARGAMHLTHPANSLGAEIKLAADAAARQLAEGDSARVFNDRASLELPVRISQRLRPGLAAIPWGWWRHHHPDGKVANSLTNDTLTDWGGGVAFSDTLVQIERAS